MGKLLDLTDQKFGRLTATRLAGRDGNRIMWECLCECGTHKLVRGSHLVSGATISCGCYRKDMMTTHGLYKHPLYHVWGGMNSRCNDSNNKAYKNYGGRGVTVCDRWRDFKNFYTDVLPTYSSGLEIDRIDVNGDYCPENCRWVTPQQNNMNRGANLRSTSVFKGVSWNLNAKKWTAKIKKDGKGKHLGYYTDEGDAARAYNKAAIELFGEYAHLNDLGITMNQLNTNGTPHSLEDCYEAILIDAGIDLEIEWEEPLDND